MVDAPGLTQSDADSVHGHTRQIASAWVDVRSAELYVSGTESLQPDFASLTKARQSAYLGQHCLSEQATIDPLFAGMDLVHAPSWTRPMEPSVGAPQATTTTGPLPNTSVERWRTGFTPEAQGTRPPVEFVRALQLNQIASLPELMSQAPAD